MWRTNVACPNCQLQTATATVDLTSISVTAALIGAAIVGLYYLSKEK